MLKIEHSTTHSKRSKARRTRSSLTKLLEKVGLVQPVKQVPVSPVGTLPRRKWSVMAHVLAKLLSGQSVNSLELVQEAQTSRLSDLIAKLKSRYGWLRICSCRFAVGTDDGRVVSVMHYWLDPQVLAKAQTEETMTWAQSVLEARRIQRSKACSAAIRALTCNTRNAKKRESRRAHQTLH